MKSIVRTLKEPTMHKAFARAAEQTDVDLGQPELGPRRGEDDVPATDEPETGAKGRAVDGDNDRTAGGRPATSAC